MKRLTLILKRLMLVSVISGLITSNILTLLNNEFHQTAFDSLTKTLGYVVAEKTLSNILRNSPAQEIKTIKIRQQKRIDITKRISKLIAVRTEKLALSSFRSFLPRITPVMGIAITALLTIDEIHDNCQTLRDLNKLAVDFEIEGVDETTVCGIDITDITKYLD
jgi:hypothetical protein